MVMMEGAFDLREFTEIPSGYNSVYVNGLDSRTAIARLVRPFLRRRSWTFIHAGMSGISQRPYSMGKNGWASFSDARLDPRYTAIELCFFFRILRELVSQGPHGYVEPQKNG